MKKTLYLCLFILAQSAGAMDLEFPSIESIRRTLMDPTRSVREVVPIRQADIGFIVEKTWVEKDAQGNFSVQSERVCTRRAKANVYDVRNQQWNYPSLTPLATCQTILDARDGTAQYQFDIQLGGFIYLNTNPDGRSMKNFVPWAFQKSDGGPKWPMQGFMMTSTLDLQETAFSFGGQSEQFYKNQTLVVTASFGDKNAR